MILKEAKYKKCSKCGTTEHIISGVVYGCDICKKEVSEDALHAYVYFNRGSNYKTLDFCSWKHVFDYLKKMSKKNVSQIQLPRLLPVNIKEFL